MRTFLRKIKIACSGIHPLGCLKASSLVSQREKGDYDGIENFNFYSPEFAGHSLVPKCILPFMDEITVFCDVDKSFSIGKLQL
jgi:hypothetical protein